VATSARLPGLICFFLCHNSFSIGAPLPPFSLFAGVWRSFFSLPVGRESPAYKDLPGATEYPLYPLFFFFSFFYSRRAGDFGANVPIPLSLCLSWSEQQVANPFPPLCAPIEKSDDLSCGANSRLPFSFPPSTLAIRTPVSPTCVEATRSTFPARRSLLLYIIISIFPQRVFFFFSLHAQRLLQLLSPPKKNISPRTTTRALERTPFSFFFPLARCTLLELLFSSLRRLGPFSSMLFLKESPFSSQWWYSPTPFFSMVMMAFPTRAGWCRRRPFLGFATPLFPSPFLNQLPLPSTPLDYSPVETPSFPKDP